MRASDGRRCRRSGGGKDVSRRAPPRRALQRDCAGGELYGATGGLSGAGQRWRRAVSGETNLNLNSHATTYRNVCYWNPRTFHPGHPGRSV